jgi:L,D-transpeptidase ErfK/SrfK
VIKSRTAYIIKKGLLQILVCLFVFYPAVTTAQPESIIMGCRLEDRILKPSDPPLKGYDVEELQERLAQLGYYQGGLSGIYDEKTQACVKRFHLDCGMEDIPIVTLKTWEALAVGVRLPQKKTDLVGKSLDGEVNIIIDKYQNSLVIYKDNEAVKSYPVAIGKNNTPTPVGEFKIANKAYKPGGALGTRWMGLNVPWGSYGIHGTNRPWSIGRRASAGCIRMHNQHVEEVFALIPVGTPVIITGDYPPLGQPLLKQGTNSQNLIPVQFKLREQGLPRQSCFPRLVKKRSCLCDFPR